MEKRITHAKLVYQGGIANVFATKRFACASKRERLIQSDFNTCESFARGLQSAGVRVESMYCNQAGDILEFDAWDSRLDDAPFSNSFRPVGKDGGYQLRVDNPGVFDELNG